MKKGTPLSEPEEPKAVGGCAAVVVLFLILTRLAAVRLGWWWIWLFWLPCCFIIVYWGYGKALLLWALLVYRPRHIDGVLITSDARKWDRYIQENWLELFGHRFVVLNWSKHNQWERSLAARLFRHFGYSPRNFCPAVILLRGLERPLVLRFFYAFRDHRHGNDAALRKLERRLFLELGLIHRPE